MAALLPTFAFNKIALQFSSNVASTASLKVVGKKLHLERVLFNLMENAARYSPPNSTVALGLEERGDYLLFTVDDEGPGVAQDVSETLFQKFSRSGSKPGRAGIGLYFCRITIERWGGTIGHLPRPEGGSRFWICLPKLAL